MPKSLPVVPVANSCVVFVKPFTDEIDPDPPLNKRGVHIGDAGVPVFTLNTLSVVLNSSKPAAGKGIAFCWVVVIRGARKPLLVLLISNMALPSGKPPVALIAIFCA